MKFYISTVTGLAMLLLFQDFTKGVFGKFFQNFQNKYIFYVTKCNTSRRLLLSLKAILIVPAPSFLPYLYVGTRGGGWLTSLEFYVGSSHG